MKMQLYMQRLDGVSVCCGGGWVGPLTYREFKILDLFVINREESCEACTVEQMKERAPPTGTDKEQKTQEGRQRSDLWGERCKQNQMRSA